MNRIVGRKYELELLEDASNSKRSELIAVYGRRRIGKTYLVRTYFKNELVFEVAGLYNGSMKDQLTHFSKQFKAKQVPTSWMEAFEQLEAFLDKRKSSKKKVIFIDEFPWFDTARSKFLMAFDNFWNSYCTKRTDLIVVICGSAASYMIKKIIKNKGGLHNRITQKIRLLPFDLNETNAYLNYLGIHYTFYDVLQIYMTLGGVPYYLEKLKKGKSVTQNIDNLCFEKDGALRTEFDILFTSLFTNSEHHLKITKALAGTNKGMTRQNLIDKVCLPSGGDFTLKLEELVESGFVSEHPFYQNKRQLIQYRLSDEYIKFYLKFIQNNQKNGTGTWMRLFKSQSYHSWSGIAFENCCLKHITQIKKALRIDAIYSTESSWFNDRAQIDLLIDRDDNVINLCEIKFYSGPYAISGSYYENLKNKVQQFSATTNTKKTIFVTMITSYGLITNAYSTEIVQNSLSLEAFFS